MPGLGKAAELDSVAMRTIAVVTMVWHSHHRRFYHLVLECETHYQEDANKEQAVFSISFFSYAPGQGYAALVSLH
jgi:hypothetical protein